MVCFDSSASECRDAYLSLMGSFCIIANCYQTREEILVHFCGSDLQNYFTKMLEDLQFGDMLKKKNKHTNKEGWDCFKWATETGELIHILDHDVGVLSGDDFVSY